MKGLKIIVSGRVQGVGFRYFTVRKAQDYHILGSVKNMSDGSVEIIAYGDDENLPKFLSDIQKGPSFSFVTDCSVAEIPDSKAPARFKIEH